MWLVPLVAQRLRGSGARGSAAPWFRGSWLRGPGSAARGSEVSWLRGPAQRSCGSEAPLVASPACGWSKTGGLSGLVLGLSGLVHILGLSVYGLVQLVRFGACPGLVHFGACPSRGLSSLGLRFYLLLLKVESPFSP